MRTIPIPIASRLNSEAKPGRHSPEETPFIQNMRLESGVAIKSMGWSTVLEKLSILEAHRIDSQKWLVVAADTAGAAHADIYLWDSSGFTKLTMPAGYDFETGYDSATGRYKNIFFDDIYDTRVLIDTDGDGADDDTVTPSIVTVITNGLCTPLMYRHDYTAPAGLFALPSTADDVTIGGTTYKKGAGLKAEKVAALKDVLYWCNITNFDTTATQKIYNHRLLWSVTKQIGFYNDWDNYKDFTQGGDKLTGIKAVADNLYAVRENSVWVTTTGYDTFARAPAPGGSTTSRMAEFFGKLVYNSYGKIVVLGESNPFLSDIIHTMLAGEGPPEDVAIVADEYSRKIYISTGQKLFVYDYKYGTWSMDQFDEQVKIVGVMPTGSVPASGWSDPPSLHSELSVSEEEILCDPVIILGGTKLKKCNHFYSNMGIVPGDMAAGALSGIIASISDVGGKALLSATAHGFQEGDMVLLAIPATPSNPRTYTSVASAMGYAYFYYSAPIVPAPPANQMVRVVGTSDDIYNGEYVRALSGVLGTTVKPSVNSPEADSVKFIGDSAGTIYDITPNTCNGMFRVTINPSLIAGAGANAFGLYPIDTAAPGAADLVDFSADATGTFQGQSPLYDAWVAEGGSAYESIYETPLVPLAQGLEYAMAWGFLIEGEHAGYIAVQSFFTDAPKTPVWQDEDSVELDEDGTVQLDIASGRCRYAAFRLSTNDKVSLKLSSLGILVSGGGRR